MFSVPVKNFVLHVGAVQRTLPPLILQDSCRLPPPWLTDESVFLCVTSADKQAFSDLHLGNVQDKSTLIFLGFERGRNVLHSSVGFCQTPEPLQVRLKAAQTGEPVRPKEVEPPVVLEPNFQTDLLQ